MNNFPSKHQPSGKAFFNQTGWHEVYEKPVEKISYKKVFVGLFNLILVVLGLILAFSYILNGGF